MYAKRIGMKRCIACCWLGIAWPVLRLRLLIWAIWKYCRPTATATNTKKGIAAGQLECDAEGLEAQVHAEGP